MENEIEDKYIKWEKVSNDESWYFKNEPSTNKWITNSDTVIVMGMFNSRWSIEISEDVSYDIKYAVSGSVENSKFEIYIDGKILVKTKEPVDETSINVTLLKGNHTISVYYSDGTGRGDKNSFAYIILDDIDYSNKPDINPTPDTPTTSVVVTPGVNKLSPVELEKLMIQKGNEELQKHSIIINFNGTVFPEGNNSFVFDKDYFIGDYVTIHDEQLNIYADLQITGFTKSLTESGEIIDLIFGNEKVTLYKAVKRLEDNNG